eukprot:gb/GFBE01058811.1/.p1 GENE.gb/GFBE01058811.1/~~gb/GFBE01058811.1/.p1  ORF type:complete len:347 (+),score=71.93 gb/GFBE01058811.1/:1-1041(+)
MHSNGKKIWASQEGSEEYARMFDHAAGAKSGGHEESIRVWNTTSGRRQLYDGAAGRTSAEADAAGVASSPRVAATHVLDATVVGSILKPSLQGDQSSSARREDAQYQQLFDGAAGAKAPSVWRYHDRTKFAAQEASASREPPPRLDLLEVIQQHERQRQEQLQQQQERMQQQELRYRQAFEGAHGVLQGGKASEGKNLRSAVGRSVDSATARLQLEAQLFEGAAGVKSVGSPHRRGIRIDPASNASQLDEIIVGRDVDHSAERMEAHWRQADWEGAAGCKSSERSSRRRLQPAPEAIVHADERPHATGAAKVASAAPSAQPWSGQDRDSIDRLLSGLELTIIPPSN